MRGSRLRRKKKKKKAVLAVAVAAVAAVAAAEELRFKTALPTAERKGAGGTSTKGRGKRGGGTPCKGY
jgi:hypothetical protein